MSRLTPIYVTQPHLPPLAEFIPMLEQIWDSRILTNCGPFHQQLEASLGEYLGVEHLSLVANGTLALVISLKALGIAGEIITTPYSFVATAHSAMWNGIRPVFVDIDEQTLNIDPRQIEAAITEHTTAILPVHTYGHPCDCAAIQAIADKHGLRVIYDAAHAFGVADYGGSILRHGDLSVLSFHATKVFNTFEGGAIVSPDLKTKQHIDQLRNFGFVNETSVTELGINGKMSEICAAMGLLQLKHIDTAIAARRKIHDYYKRALRQTEGIHFLGSNASITDNYSYFPIFIDDNYTINRDQLYEKFRQSNINVRRYFYPLISDFSMYQKSGNEKNFKLPVAIKKSNQVLCLPIYPELTNEQLQLIVDIIIN